MNTSMLTLRRPALHLASAAMFVVAVLAAGCDFLEGHQLRKEFCDAHPMDAECMRAFPDADTRCMSNASCMAPTAVCDLAGTQMCVQCVAPSDVAACTGTTPACGADRACHACSKHDDCPSSSACLPDGSCAVTTQVAYVDPTTGTGSQCTQAAPCKKVSDALGTMRPYVKLTGTIDEPVTINNQNVTIIASSGAKLTRSNAGVILRVDGTSVVTIADLSISDGLGGTGIGISLPPGNSAALTLLRATVNGNAGGGISASGGMLTISQGTINGNAGGGISASGGTLNISRSTISGNTGAGNTGGGVSITGAQFDITNSFIIGNGSAATTLGGIRVDGITVAGAHRIEFNTITANIGPGSVDTGITCGAVLVPLVFANNIIYGNVVSGGGLQFGGNVNCSATYSDVGPDALAGVGNINQDPQFARPAQADYHIQASSPARDAADPAATLAVDFDGDARPQGARRDMGADEVKP